MRQRELSPIVGSPDNSTPNSGPQVGCGSLTTLHLLGGSLPPLNKEYQDPLNEKKPTGDNSTNYDHQSKIVPLYGDHVDGDENESGGDGDELSDDDDDAEFDIEM